MALLVFTPCLNAHCSNSTTLVVKQRMNATETPTVHCKLTVTLYALVQIFCEPNGIAKITRHAYDVFLEVVGR